MRPRENVLRFIDIEHGDEKVKDERSCNTEGIYKDIEKLISVNNTKCKSAESHFYFKQRNATDGKIGVRLNCENDGNCKKTHYVNFSNNLLRIVNLKQSLRIMLHSR